MNTGLFLNIFLIPVLLGGRFPDDATPEGHRRVFHFANLKSAYMKMNEGGPIAITEFRTEFKPRARGNAATEVATETILENRLFAARVQGAFTVKKSIRGIVPKVEQVSKSYLFNRSQAGRNANLLLEVTTADPVLTFLVIYDPIPGSTLESVMVGPIYAHHVNDIIDAAAVIEKSEDTPEAMVESSNPWLVYFGLAQLDSERRLSVPHFWAASNALPLELTENLSRDLYDASIGNRRLRTSMDRVFLKAVTSFDSNRQRIWLNQFNNFIDGNKHLTGEVIDFLSFRKGIAVYRQMIADDNARSAVVREIDRILRKEPPPIK